MSAPKLDTGFIKTFAMAALEVLKVQCSFDAKAGKPFQKGSGPELDISIAGVIGITATAFSGTISIGFPEKTFLKVMSGMLGENFDTITKDLEDGAGELTNIIFGCAKKTLNDGGYDISRAIPTVVRGDKMRITPMSKAPVVIIPIESAGGNFQIEIVLE